MAAQTRSATEPMNDFSRIPEVSDAAAKLRVALSGPVRPLVERIAGAMRAQQWYESVTIGDGSPEGLPTLVAGANPDLLVLALPDASAADLALVERLGHLYPAMTPILLCDNQSPDFLMQAMRAGVREILPSASPTETLIDSIGRIGLKRVSQPDRHGNVLAFMSCKGGGGGATFLAANLAYALAEEGKRVVLIDLNLQWGDAVFFLADKRPSITLSDLAMQMHRVDPAFLAASLVRVHPNLGVLGAVGYRAVAQGRLPQFEFASCTLTPDANGVLLRAAAAKAPCSATLEAIHTLFELDGDAVLRYADPRRGVTRRVRLADDSVAAACLSGDAIGETWLREFHAQGLSVAALGARLLAPTATAPAALAARGRIVCSCHGVGEAPILAALQTAEGDAGAKLAAAQQQLRCGTQCGSCLPELRRLATTSVMAA